MSYSHAKMASGHLSRDRFGQRDGFGQRGIYSTKLKIDLDLPREDRDPKMFQNMETNRSNTHVKFGLDWISGFLKKSCDIKHTDLWIYY